MVVRRILMLMSVTMVSLLGASACGPGMESKTGAVVSSAATESGSDSVQNSGKAVVVETKPLSATELAAQPPGQSAAGAASGGLQTTPETPGEQQPSGTMTVYADSTYKFGVSYPADFKFRSQSAEKLTPLNPTPIASFIFMNPVTAASDLGDLEPADLEIRVYATGQQASLDSWLTANSLLPADGSIPLKPFQAANVSGFQVCASTMIVPNCSYYVMASGWVYQLIPITLEGESMAHTFTLNS